MDLDDLFGPKSIVIDLDAQNQWEAIDELVDHLVATDKIKAHHRDAIAASVKRRESAMSTGIGFGIGIPHASTDLICEPVAVVGRSPKGLQFDALDGQPVHLVALSLVPQAQFQKHLHTLATVAKMLHRADFRDALRRRFL